MVGKDDLIGVMPLINQDSADMVIRNCSRPLKGQGNSLANTDA